MELKIGIKIIINYYNITKKEKNLMKHLTTLFLLVFLITASFAQKLHQPSCDVYLRDYDFESAIETLIAAQLIQKIRFIHRDLCITI